jgi:predicted O-linked N-acetylglucosamine transferase (SPINDLY family)
MPTLTIPQALEFAVQHYQAGQLAEAERVCRQILTVEPRHADALHVLGVILHRAGALDAALDSIRKAIAAAPSIALYRNSLGNLLRERGQRGEAIAAYRQAIELQPDLAEALNNLGSALIDRGDLEEAVATFRQALACQPDLAAVHSNLGNALKALRRLDEAMAAHRRAVEIEPGLALARNNLGSALMEQGRVDEAADEYRRALQIDPGFTLAHANLGSALKEQGRLDEAIACFQRALQLQPNLAVAHNNLGSALMEQGRVDEAIPCFERAVGLQPASANLLSVLLATLDFCPKVTPARLFEAHCAYEERHTAPLRAQWRPHENSRDPDRPLRIGFVSPHFASHPVGRFLIRPLEHLDRVRFETFCYSDTVARDAMTTRIQTAASCWQETAALSDEQLAQRIREDCIDILFDLAGHTAGNRLPAFARKPAPIQITWLDYAGTTGLAAIDYILADAREIPPGAEFWYREEVLRMPDDYICYDPPADAPSVGPLPALACGRVTFASFNAPAKISPQIVEIWAQILRRTPHARLVLKSRSMDDQGTRTRIHQLFTTHGTDTTRIELLGWSSSAEVRSLYGEVDVALDTFPYNGGLTTCEAIWMGVPVITCPGETFASRHGLAHLTAAGFTETIARDFDEYADLAVALANDLPRLAALRAGLREQVAASPLCDGRRFAVHFATLLRDVWRRWTSAISAR